MSQRPVMIATALKLEFDAVLEYVNESETISGSGLLVRRALLNGSPLLVVCFQGMGNVRASQAVALALHKFNPIALMLVGIAGGTKKPTTEVMDPSCHLLGDALVAEHIVGYESGKQTPSGLSHRPEVFRASARLLTIAKANATGDWRLRVKSKRPDGSTDRVLPT